ncbi:MAG: hypothetical protein LBO75_04385 [Bifidobacteriaceae bacterium]|jgi:hypothetical protein|nr:hypothetical protein [Bifidobacteriaceae bacterium]
MRSDAALHLLDRLEIILEALSTMPNTCQTEQNLHQALQAGGHRPLNPAERRALSVLGRELIPG